MPKKLTIIYPDGEVKVEEHYGPFEDGDKAWLTILQKRVHGFIQMVPHFDQYDGKLCVAYVNEEGRIKNMPLNEKASALWKFFLGEGPFTYEPLIFGPLIIEQDV